MRKYFKRLFYLVALLSLSLAHAGSYEDFFRAIKQDDAGTVNQLLRRGFDANALDPARNHGLFLAVRDGSLKAAAALIAWPQTKVEWRSPKDESPLMMASLKGQTDIVRKLVARDADVNKTGWAPLHYAATNGHLEIMQILLDEHAYIDAESPNKSTPLMMAAKYGTPSAVKLLLEAGADPTLRNELGLTALDFAQQANRRDAVELISAAIRNARPKGKW
ncbi:ankyrin repeat domain-containing protein [Ramlibacter monticola]|uniref:Ankyrin repeat domain-containing protein n=1 Tax=Ramlibacter monticola TaxID=1926872 RepID=A0A936YXQ0_9BURK|nr:ankyrin repeat domain-containing protein [Ramlibacter monticola]MBL0391253.1 ankyrin repeat domain-containing protein [Ramlibacter monticola]